jgi:hypothetical protein
MGKSTLLRNLEGFLPGSVRVANLSMQRAAAFTSQSSLLALIAETALGVLGDLGPPPAREAASAVGFCAFLDDCNARLGAAGGRLLLALDEYEYLDLKLGEGVFDLDLLALIRESIQTHRHLTWVFAGNLMRPDEAAPAEWDYLRGFREQETQAPPPDDEVRRALRRRLLVTEDGEAWRLRVPLMRRWLRQRG